MFETPRHLATDWALAAPCAAASVPSINLVSGFRRAKEEFTFALARGISVGSHVTRLFGGTAVGAAGRIATKPRNVSGNTLAPIAHDPSGSTLTPSAMNRGG